MKCVNVPVDSMKASKASADVSICSAVIYAHKPVLHRYPNNGRVEQLISLESLLPNGQKKVPKVYQIACHPLQPHLIAVAANAGDDLHLAGSID